MASEANDSDVELGTENESENEAVDNRSRAHETQHPSAEHQHEEGENSGRGQHSAEVRRQSERIVHTETRTETIHGLDELSTCINSVDDHVQAGLQELRNCVTNLRRERSEMTEKLRTLSNEVFQVTNDRDRCQQAIMELQQEVSSLREQLCHQQQDKENLLQRMQEMQQTNEDHLVSIAGKQRKKRLAHNAIVRWRRKTFDKKLGFRDQLRMLEEENSELRAELLLCQEAAKQAFLRSANALNSEALTMFQDAATRRLGFEETSPQGSPATEFSSPSNSPLPQAHGSHASGNDYLGAMGEDKENIRGHRDARYTQRTVERERVGDDRERLSQEGAAGSDDSRSFLATHRRGENVNIDQEHYPSGNVFPGSHGAYGLHGNIYGGHGSHHRPMGPYQFSYAGEGFGAVGSRGPQQTQQPAPASTFDPNSLQQETRAYLQQLREDRRRRPEPPPTSGFESQRKTMKTVASQHDPKRKMCNCRTHVGADTAAAQVPYKCPYCTPVQNSSFGHAKEPNKKAPNIVHRNKLLGTKADKKVLYKPSASTIVIEKHIAR